jgi:protein ImuA
MKLISCHDGKLHTLDTGGAVARRLDRNDLTRPAAVSTTRAFCTDLKALDALSPGGAFARGAVHELLHVPGHAAPMFPAALLAKCAADASAVAAAAAGQNAVVWSDPNHELYPPALAALGIPLERVFLLHPASEADQTWALAECLRCRSVSAVVAALPPRQRLTRVEARRLQLAAEQGGGVGLLMRSNGRSSNEHAAVTRWLVRSEPGERNVQRWRIQLIFGHGGQVGQSVILEHHRDRHAKPLLPHLTAHPVRPPAELADRPAAAREKPTRMAAG